MEIKKFINVPDKKLIDSIQELHVLIFGHPFSFERLQTKNNILMLLAIEDNKVIGYKIGYEENEKYFYSWIGGVHPNYRNYGIASKLMYLQHSWCEENGYQAVKTKTKNKWRNMLILNLKHGFDIIGTYTDSKGEAKIILQKQLEKGK
ncbi:GNAT family N-acetyltransferase [Bacillus sp. FJAT-47783]|uniref:GNAT family N-acetyltransferase n=1 Tax=Bacillus sp. FJAT-47783 TaxID=2922712 RepID=UPI001FAC4C4F|nr:GNAT family N-acetyltransferase [Bacillus sp. FJAT-47783]